jgi:hypothetical protein
VIEGWVWLTVAGLAADIIGAWILAAGLFISKEEAVELSVSRAAGSSVVARTARTKRPGACLDRRAGAAGGTWSCDVRVDLPVDFPPRLLPSTGPRARGLASQSPGEQTDSTYPAKDKEDDHSFSRVRGADRCGTTQAGTKAMARERWRTVLVRRQSNP